MRARDAMSAAAVASSSLRPNCRVNDRAADDRSAPAGRLAEKGVDEAAEGCGLRGRSCGEGLRAVEGELGFGFAGDFALCGSLLLFGRELELAGGGDALGDLEGGFAAGLAVAFPGLFGGLGALGVGVGAVEGGGGSRGGAVRAEGGGAGAVGRLAVGGREVGDGGVEPGSAALVGEAWDGLLHGLGRRRGGGALRLPAGGSRRPWRRPSPGARSSRTEGMGRRLAVRGRTSPPFASVTMRRFTSL